MGESASNSAVNPGELYARLLAEIGARNPMLHVSLSEAQLLGAADGQLIVAVQEQETFVLKHLQRPESLGLMRAVLTQMVGAPFTVRVDTFRDAPPGLAATAAPAPPGASPSPSAPSAPSVLARAPEPTPAPSAVQVPVISSALDQLKAAAAKVAGSLPAAALAGSEEEAQELSFSGDGDPETAIDEWEMVMATVNTKIRATADLRKAATQTLQGKAMAAYVKEQNPSLAPLLEALRETFEVEDAKLSLRISTL